MKLEFSYLGRHHAASGDLFTMQHPDGNEARVYVDSLGETWVDIRRIPAGGYFHTERVKAWHAYRVRELDSRYAEGKRP